MDLADTLVADAAQEIVRALVAGVVEIVKKIPRLWHRAGEDEENLISAQIERSSLALQNAGEDLPSAMARQEGVWEGLLSAMLTHDPDMAIEVSEFIEASRRRFSEIPAAVQNITASGGIAQGVMFGQIVNHNEPSRSQAPAEQPASAPDGNKAGQ